MRFVLAAVLALASAPALARPAVTCEGVVLMGAAQLLCSHVDPAKPAQLCTFRWELSTSANVAQLVQGTLIVPPGASNVQAYEGAGFARALAPPVVLCQGRRGAG